MALLGTTSLFRVPLPTGLSGVQWGDLSNDGCTTDDTTLRQNVQMLVGSTIMPSAVNYQVSGRSVLAYAPPFTAIMPIQFGQPAYFGLNLEGAATYPTPRYARETYGWVLRTTVAGYFGQVVEVGSFIGGTVANMVSLRGLTHFAIVDDGAAVKYAYSKDDMATWVVVYTSLRPYSAVAKKISGGMITAGSRMAVIVADSALF